MRNLFNLFKSLPDGLKLLVQIVIITILSMPFGSCSEYHTRPEPRGNYYITGSPEFISDVKLCLAYLEEIDAKHEHEYPYLYEKLKYIIEDDFMGGRFTRIVGEFRPAENTRAIYINYQYYVRAKATLSDLCLVIAHENFHMTVYYECGLDTYGATIRDGSQERITLDIFEPRFKKSWNHYIMTTPMLSKFKRL